MRRTTRQRRSTISHPLAAVAALLLGFSTWLGVNDNVTPESTPAEIYSSLETDKQAEAEATQVNNTEVEDKKGGGFTMSLFLFRHG